MGYEFVYHPDKSGFMIKGIGYAKVCDYPASDFVINQAIEASKKKKIILLEGNLSFKSFKTFNEGSETCEGVFISPGEKYYPVFYGDFECEYFPRTASNIAIAIKSDNNFHCNTCGSNNNILVEKPSIHFKVSCGYCHSFITNIGTNAPAILHFGKYLGREVSSFKSNEELQYLQWLLTNSKTIKGKLKTAIENHLSL